MSASAADGFRRAPALALTLTLSVQALASLTLTAPSVLAPIAASDLGAPPQSVGWLIRIAYFAAMTSVPFRSFAVPASSRRCGPTG